MNKQNLRNWEDVAAMYEDDAISVLLRKMCQNRDFDPVNVGTGQLIAAAAIQDKRLMADSRLETAMRPESSPCGFTRTAEEWFGLSIGHRLGATIIKRFSGVSEQLVTAMPWQVRGELEGLNEVNRFERTIDPLVGGYFTLINDATDAAEFTLKAALKSNVQQSSQPILE